LKPSIKNRLDHFPNGFFQFLDGFKPSRIPNFFVVTSSCKCPYLNNFDFQNALDDCQLLDFGFKGP
jgi:hypothetical protein